MKAGRKKRKDARSYRLDLDLLDQMERFLARSGGNDTDFVEHGVMLNLRESEELSYIPRRARFLVYRANEMQQRRVIQLLGLMAMPDGKLTDQDHIVRDFILNYLGSVELMDGFLDALAKAYGAKK